MKRIVTVEGITSIHCGRGLPEGLLAWLLSKWTKTPYLCYVHGEELPTYHSSREYKLLSQWVYRGANSVIVNSKNTQRSFVVHTGFADKVRVMHPGVDINYFVPADADLSFREKMGWLSRKVMVTVGRLQKRKGHDHTILSLKRIAEKVPNILYVIIGDGEERRPLEKLVAQEGVQQYVQFLGKVDDEVMLACYQQCDLFILANREVDGDFEGFGMVLVEAQACGKPVIAGNSGGTAETMIPGETGLVVNAESPSVIAEAVTALLGDDEKLKNMGLQAVAWVRSHLDWGVLVKQAENIFSELYKKG